MINIHNTVCKDQFNIVKPYIWVKTSWTLEYITEWFVGNKALT